MAVSLGDILWVLSVVIIVMDVRFGEGTEIEIRTNKTFVVFSDESGISFVYHGIDPSDSSITENAFVFNFTGVEEVTPQGEFVQGGELIDFSIRQANSTQPAVDSSLQYDFYYL